MSGGKNKSGTQERNKSIIGHKMGIGKETT